MTYPLSELIDRYSILCLKKERLPMNKKISDEHRLFLAAIFEYKHSGVNGYIDKMKQINGKIWDLEADIRQERKMSLSEVGRRALMIRDLNKERISVKNDIAEEMDEFKEVKVDHRST